MKTDKLRRLTAASLVLAFTLPQAAQAAHAAIRPSPKALRPSAAIRPRAPKAGTNAAVSMPMLPSATASTSQPASGRTSPIMRHMMDGAERRARPESGAAVAEDEPAPLRPSVQAVLPPTASTAPASSASPSAYAYAESCSWLFHMRA